MRFIVVLGLCLSLICPVSKAQAKDGVVTVFAAASLQGGLDQVAQGFPDQVQISYGGSGTLARQISAGAPADVVILADRVWMEWLGQQGLLGATNFQNLLSNRLVLIAPASGALKQGCPDDLATFLPVGERLAMGQRDGVPAGRYAQQWLRHIGQWDALAPRLAETDNVRTALAMVARGQTALGVVYATDAMAEPKVRVICEIPANMHQPIHYPAAQLTPEGAAFLGHLLAPPALAIFQDHGFGLPDPK